MQRHGAVGSLHCGVIDTGKLVRESHHRMVLLCVTSHTVELRALVLGNQVRFLEVHRRANPLTQALQTALKHSVKQGHSSKLPDNFGTKWR